MSEPSKKPGQQPESYQPRRPEIVTMAAQAQGEARTNASAVLPWPFQAGSPMRPTDYDFHFSGFRGLDFTNCFTALFMYLEGIQGGGQPSLTLANHAVQHFFLFDTISGRSATVWGWGGKPTAVYGEIYDTDDTIGFVMGYAGYSYERRTGNLMEHIRASLDGGIPVLARLKTGRPYTDKEADSFRLIVGCDGNRLRVPAPKGAQKASKKAPRLNEIDSVYVVTGRTQRKYTLLDALRRIRGIMERDREAGVWDEYFHAFEDYWGNLQKLKLKELKALFQSGYRGTTWNCHNFVETFRTYSMNPQCPERFNARVWDELKGARLEAPCNRMDAACDDSHNRQWQLHALHDIRNWRSRYRHKWGSGMLNWSMCEMAATLLRMIKADDEAVYGAVCEMIDILEQGEAP